jgi:hypothetical protein
MQAYKLAKQLNPQISDPVLEELGSGADGDVYSLSNDPNKVIKYSVYYCWDGELLSAIIENRIAAFSAVQQKSDLFAKIYDFKYLGSGKRKVISGDQNYLLFSCVMEKLTKISEDEKKVFHSILSHEDSNKVKTFSIEKVISMLQGMGYGLDFNQREVLDFYKRVINSSIIYTDLHPRNIMKNKLGQFRLIDFDRIDVS